MYLALQFVIPPLVNKNQILLTLATAAQNFAWLFAGMFLLPAVSSVFMQRKRQQLITQQKSIQSLRETSWQDFEILVAEAFRRQGYSVQENMVAGPDGGIDLNLRKDGKQHIVQCKRWRSSKVGVSIVREMYGVLTASKADSVYVVSSGEFTKDAIEFAQNLPIKLINGQALLELIAEIQSETLLPIKGEHQTITPADSKPINTCPKCNSQLVTRTAKKGTHTGKQFLGCSNFPRCRYVGQI
ncbi:restriction endonuclease [Aliiglaciecola aliphaticivorans]